MAIYRAARMTSKWRNAILFVMIALALLFAQRVGAFRSICRHRGLAETVAEDRHGLALVLCGGRSCAGVCGAQGSAAGRQGKLSGGESVGLGAAFMIHAIEWVHSHGAMGR